MKDEDIRELLSVYDGEILKVCLVCYISVVNLGGDGE